MKKNHLNGRVLSEKEMMEVKGGRQQVGHDPENWKCCPFCATPYDDDEEYGRAIYDPLTGLWGRTCLYCGGIINEE